MVESEQRQRQTEPEPACHNEMLNMLSLSKSYWVQQTFQLKFNSRHRVTLPRSSRLVIQCLFSFFFSLSTLFLTSIICSFSRSPLSQQSAQQCQRSIYVIIVSTVTSLCMIRKNENYAVDDFEVAALTKIKILFVATSALVVPLKQKQIVDGKHQICVVKMKMTQQMNVVARAKEFLSRTTQNAESRSLNMSLFWFCKYSPRRLHLQSATSLASFPHTSRVDELANATQESI